MVPVNKSKFDYRSFIELLELQSNILSYPLYLIFIFHIKEAMHDQELQIVRLFFLQGKEKYH